MWCKSGKLTFCFSFPSFFFIISGTFFHCFSYLFLFIPIRSLLLYSDNTYPSKPILIAASLSSSNTPACCLSLLSPFFPFIRRSTYASSSVFPSLFNTLSLSIHYSWCSHSRHYKTLQYCYGNDAAEAAALDHGKLGHIPGAGGCRGCSKGRLLSHTFTSSHRHVHT